ncbi:MAG: TonB-dependent receptor [Hyphomonadaceae bacterium]
MNARFLLGLSCAAGAMMAEFPAMAQQAESKPPADERQSDERSIVIEERGDEIVTITGSSFNEVLDQPQSVSVIDAEDRNLAGVGNVRQLVDVMPGFVFTNEFGLNVRGVGRQTPQTLLGQENAVVQYVDGFINLVPFNIAESTLFGGNVQFLRGPGGTLYGRNSIAGSVNLLSRAPTSSFTGEIEIGVGREGWYDVGFNISGPITEELEYRLGIQKFHGPTLQDNIGSAKDAGFATDNTYYEFQLEYEGDRLHVRNRATHFDYNNQPGYPTVATYNTGPVFGGLAPNPQYNYNVQAPSEPFQINVDYVGYDKLDNNFQDILNIDYDLDFATLVYVGGYQQYVALGSADLDLTSRASYVAAPTDPFAPGTVVPTDYRSNYDNDNNFWSQELRLESKPGDALNWVVGAYYFNQHFDERYWENIPGADAVLGTPTQGNGPALAAPNPDLSTYEQRNVYNIRSTAVFGNIVYDISDALRLDTGLRYTWDDKGAKTNFRYVYYYPPLFAGDFSPVVHAAQPQQSDSDLSGRIALAWAPASGQEIYAAYSRGYQASAFTLGQGLPPNNIAEPQTLDVYELGWTYEVGDLRFDGSVFLQNFFDMQIPISARSIVNVNGEDQPVGPVYSRFENAEKAVISGAEFQATWQPTDRSNIVFSYTYLDPTFDSFCPIVPGANPPVCGAVDITEPDTNQTPQDLSGNDIPRTPRHKASVHGYFGIALPDGSYLYPGGSIAYQGDYYASAFNQERFHVDERTITGLSLTWRSADDRIDVTASASNVFDELYSDNVNVAVIGGETARTLSYGADRFYSVVMRYRF